MSNRTGPYLLSLESPKQLVMARNALYFVFTSRMVPIMYFVNDKNLYIHRDPIHWRSGHLTRRIAVCGMRPARWSTGFRKRCALHCDYERRFLDYALNFRNKLYPMPLRINNKKS